MGGLLRRFHAWLPTFYVAADGDRLRVLRDVALPAGGRLNGLSYLRSAGTWDVPGSLTVDLWSVRPGPVRRRDVDDMCRNLEDVATWVDGIAEAVEMRRGAPAMRVCAEVRGNLLAPSVAPDPGIDRLVLGGRRLRLWTADEGKGFEPYVPEAEVGIALRALEPLRRELAASAAGARRQRRRWPRRALRIQGRMDVLGEEGEVVHSRSVIVRDLSLDGTGLEVRDEERLPAVAAPSAVRLWLPQGLGRACRLSGELIRVSRRSGVRCGIRFNSLSPADRQALTDLLHV